MIASLPPGLILILGGLLAPIVSPRFRPFFLLALPLIGGYQIWQLPYGSFGEIHFFSYTLTLVRVDKLSLVFGAIFHIAVVINVIYGWRERDVVQQASAQVYAGAAIAAVFVGDLISLFVFWELTAIASVFLIWASKTERAYWSGLRYLVIQVGSGVILLAGVVLHYRATGSIAFDKLGLVSFPTALIFIAFGIKCAFPLLHNWLQDAYPEATVVGTVVLSAFTTKLAVYALARGYPGTEILIWIGAIMTAFPVFFAVIENDLRRVLAYSLNNQLGFMVVGIGVGTPLALNGTVAHAFCHILYKSLLFMSMGAVLHRAGTIKASELGGLYKSMPLTMIFCVVGAASISAFPLFSGFISKSLIMSATADNGHVVVWLILLFASAGVLEHSGIKIPYFAFFAHDSGIRCEEAPRCMLIAMAIAAAFCIGLGVYPKPLYDILPFVAPYVPYTVTHVVTQLQLLVFAILAFGLLIRHGIYPPEQRSTVLNTDWIYRRAGPAVLCFLRDVVSQMHVRVLRRAQVRLQRFIATVYRHHGPQGALGRTWPAGSMVLWVAVLLCTTLIFYYFE